MPRPAALPHLLVLRLLKLRQKAVEQRLIAIERRRAQHRAEHVRIHRAVIAEPLLGQRLRLRRPVPYRRPTSPPAARSARRSNRVSSVSPAFGVHPNSRARAWKFFSRKPPIIRHQIIRHQSVTRIERQRHRRLHNVPLRIVVKRFHQRQRVGRRQFPASRKRLRIAHQVRAFRRRQPPRHIACRQRRQQPAFVIHAIIADRAIVRLHPCGASLRAFSATVCDACVISVHWLCPAVPVP